jgi:hypothetical protein
MLRLFSVVPPVAKVAVTFAPLAVVAPMMLTAPSFSKYWLPIVPVPVAPVTTQLTVAVPEVKLFVPLTNIWPWLTNARLVKNCVALVVSEIVQTLLPVPVACRSVAGI